MFGFILAGIRGRGWRAALLAAGVLMAASSFILLTSAVSTSTLEVIGTVRRSFRPAYDILVRPPGSFAELERREGLVRANYLSGIFGGITFQQYREIRDIPGVEVAAPIANIGYILPFAFVPITIDGFLSADPVQLYRLRLRWLANGGSSTYAASDQYVYFTRSGRFRAAPREPGGVVELARSGERFPVCSGFPLSKPDLTGPFARAGATGLMCFSARTPDVQGGVIDYGPLPAGKVGTVITASFPILLAAIDPPEEQRLIDIGATIVDGRMLRSADRPSVERRSSRTPLHPALKWRVVPFIASIRTYVDEQLRVTVERLDVPPPEILRRRLSSPEHAYGFVRALTGEPIATTVRSIGPMYVSLLRSMTGPVQRLGISYESLWTASPVRYRTRGSRLSPLPRTNRSEFAGGYYGAGWAPQENRDVQFRRLVRHTGSTGFTNGVFDLPAIRIVGRFDPERLPGFSPLSRVPLESYYPPVALPADRASREALGGRPLLPTMNLGDYVAQPPMLFTNLRGLRAFADRDAFAGVDEEAPISAIRVRVAGVRGPDPLSRERIRRVAELIHRRTGLAVDITAGSSPRPVLVELPPGRFGRPRLLLSEPWVEKGVAVRYLEALDRKSLALSLLVLLAAGSFLANGALASVRARRAELGTLLCLGWDGGRLARAVLGELALVGAAAGTAGAGLALGLGRALGLEVGLPRALLVPPVGLALALASGLAPALRAAGGSPLDAVRPPAHPAPGLRAVRRLPSMALAELLRLPSRAVVGSAGLLVGAGALAFLLAAQLGFRGLLVGTLLGRAISLEVRGVDLLSASLTAVLGAVSVADVLALNLRERAPELALLRAAGWSGRHLGLLLALEAAAVGALGAVPGAAAGAGAALLLGGGGAALPAGAAAAGGGVALALLASTVPALALGRTATARPLAEE